MLAAVLMLYYTLIKLTLNAENLKLEMMSRKY